MAKQITGHTRMACLLGSPVAHSISPAMHNEAFEQLGIDCTYLAFDADTAALPVVVEGLRKMNVVGFNLTMPDKNLMCELCDELTPAAKIGGAVNTVLNKDGKFIGYTTDGIGFMEACKNAGFDIIGKKMTLLGAGGAATAILIQAALDGLSEISIFIHHSYRERTEKIIATLNNETNCKVTLYSMDDPDILKREILNSAILTNATSVGMAPNTDACVIKDSSVFTPDLMVYDAIYNPEETKLLKMAKDAGCRTANGLYMLLYQGAAAFKIWTGQDMPVDIIKEKYFTR
ncbi:MAG: shikimate dehydrogenase [Lachnospiraceae bacterium]|jgi:quinate/shikimate dehydrogenase|nr:shikimate dehydrogenase [Lachnospiraceae bacterium]MDD3615183.1 shikimate dehydrogenase [Lachnospiraceae bacterium]